MPVNGNNFGIEASGPVMFNIPPKPIPAGTIIFKSGSRYGALATIISRLLNESLSISVFASVGIQLETFHVPGKVPLRYIPAPSESTQILNSTERFTFKMVVSPLTVIDAANERPATSSARASGDW